jgi:quinoprotein glucose dehydrogenase
MKWSGLLLACTIAMPRAQGQGPRAQARELRADSTTLSGVYTREQAARGRNVYAGNCRSCHAPESHTGKTFETWWRGNQLSELFTFVSTQMPKNDPGSLAAEDVADVIAYLLQMNAMPPGKRELYPDADSLKQYRIELTRGLRAEGQGPRAKAREQRSLGPGPSALGPKPSALGLEPSALVVRGNAAGEWRYWGADAWSTRYSPLDQIDASNFDSLKVAWVWNASQYGDDEYYRTTPLYANGRLLTVATTRRKAFAIDPSTGKTLWEWGMDEGIRWQKAPRQFAGRGLAYWTDGREERAIVVTPGFHLVSLDAKTGKPDPKFGKKGIVDLMEGLGFPLVPLAVDDSGPLIISEAAPARRARPGDKWDPVTKTGADGTVGIDPAHGQVANSSPAIVVNDVIVLGNSSMHGYYPIRLHNLPGWVFGFDVRTGKRLWKFNLIPQPGEFGAETWEAGSKLGSPGVGKNDAWAPYSADPALGLVYIPVGMPLSDEYGGHRPGDNLFGNSVVAIDVKTGRRKWHFQMIHHDIWDWDTPMAPNLLDVTVNGQRRKLLAQTTKQGWIYVFDRVTGEPIWPIVETPVPQSEVPGEKTSPTQPIPNRPAPYAQQGLMESDLIDYTPAIKDSALKLAKQCRGGPYYIPPSLANEPSASGYHCSWYAPGASGGVNIDGGAAVDVETGMMYVGAQTAGPTTGMGMIEVQKDPCSEHRYSQPHDSCGLPGALTPPPGHKKAEIGPAFGSRNPSIGEVSIFKFKELGGITAYDMSSGDKKWWVPNGNLWREVTTNDPLFAGITLPKIPALGGQAEVITTKTLVIHGTGRSGARLLRGAPGTPTAPRLFAFDKATGKQVGAVDIPAVNTAVPMTFMHAGKQYVVFAAGQGSDTKLIALALP